MKPKSEHALGFPVVTKIAKKYAPNKLNWH